MPQNIKPNWKIIDCGSSIIDMKKHVEYAARNCYQSGDKITDDSYIRMIDKILKPKGHYSPMGHGAIYLTMYKNDYLQLLDRLHIKEYLKGVDMFQWFACPMWTRIVNVGDYWYISTNYRAIYEAGIEDLLEKYWTEPTQHHVKRVTIEITADRGTQDELMRHFAAICCESTRYCIYGDKLTISEPYWLQNATEEVKSIYTKSVLNDESTYKRLIDAGLKAQDARYILPLGIKATTIYSNFVDMWGHVFDMRTTSAAHPEIRAIMLEIAKEFKNRGFTEKSYE